MNKSVVLRWVRVWLIASTLSGVPSTPHAVMTGRAVPGSTRAAASLLGGSGVPRGVVAHVVVSARWTAVLGVVDQRQPVDAWTGAVAGAVIALVDPEVVGRRLPAVREPPKVPRWTGHVAFGALLGAALQSSKDEGGRNPAASTPVRSA